MGCVVSRVVTCISIECVEGLPPSLFSSPFGSECRPLSCHPRHPPPHLLAYVRRVDATGAALIANGMPWKPHLYLMIVSAKLLADTENMLQDSSGSATQKAKQQQQQ